MKIQYGTQTIHCIVQRNARIKNTYITVERDQKVLVKVPKDMPDNKIQVLVKSKAKWIMKKIKEVGRSVDYGDIVTGSRLFYLGKSYYVEILKEESRKDIRVVFNHSKFKIYTPPEVDQIELNQAIDRFYKIKAEKKVLKLLRAHSNRMKLYPEYVGFRKSAKRWGSCSERNRITFNTEIIKLPSELIEYIVLHEMVHIVYKNHSKAFWKLVRAYMYDYEKIEEKLTEFERKL
ncbi:M48 family metallopeptidase [Sulfurimonas paralvinellae]|uniref:M48 family metallopeptidase n=1 Tax=Sulfurimonas paralvinellae TaxID=317658 RepID=A0A7M1B8I9_9BACT|nr:SprT family zinc-dependent metalloprotease [Sulfurimonas paralvinellae]QOP46049.1 M48 family metallopeptidase [Sulfurimonas paralvinellae]